MREAETLRLVDAIGADLYEWLDTTDFTSDSNFVFIRSDGKEITVTKEQYTALMNGGYYPGDCCGSTKRRSEGLITAIAYIAYARFIMNNPINATAFGVRYKDGEFSSRVEDSVLIRNSSEARKIGEAYLEGVIGHLKALGLIVCEEYIEIPRAIYRIGRNKL